MSEPGGRPVAVVTGATGGIGREVVAALCTDHDVVAIGRRPDAVARLAAMPATTVWPLDLTDFAALGEHVAALPRIDALVHAAAVSQPLGVAQARVEQWLHQLTTNVVAPAELTRLCLPALRRSAGHVVFVGSGAGTRPVPGNAVYTATKHALKGMADVLRIDEAGSGVRVSTVAPGHTDTAMLRASNARLGLPYEPERYIRPASVAGAVRFVLDSPPDTQLTDLAVRPRREIDRR